MNIDMIGMVFLLATLALISYSIIKKKAFGGADDKEVQEAIKLTQQQIEEANRRQRVMDRVDEFLKTSKFIEPIATWRNDPIYRYVFNEGVLYEFNEIMAPTNSSIGVSDDFLCFKQLCYKRVNNPIDFINKFTEQILEKTYIVEDVPSEIKTPLNNTPAAI